MYMMLYINSSSESSAVLWSRRDPAMNNGDDRNIRRWYFPLAHVTRRGLRYLRTVAPPPLPPAVALRVELLSDEVG